MNLRGDRRPEPSTTARSSTCSSSRPAAARRKPTSAWPPSPWSTPPEEPGHTPRPGLSVLMRYTLRLLTLDQLSRAATLICALELERQKDAGQAGPLAVRDRPLGRPGRHAEPDGLQGRQQPELRTRRRPSPSRTTTASLARSRSKNAPGAATKFKPDSFQLVPNPDEPTDLRVVCVNRDCDFTRNQPLPILAVDEPIYRRLPCFLIATVDKFAAMPWTGQVGGFFGRVDRYDKHGFYGPCEPDRRTAAAGTAAAAGPDHPGRAAPDLRPDGNDGRAVRVGPGRAVQPGRSTARRSGPRSSPRRPRSAGPRTRSGRCSTAGGRHLPAAGPRPPRFVLRRDPSDRQEQRPALPGRRRPGTQPQGRHAADLPGPARGRPEGVRGRRRQEEPTTTPPIPT